MSNIDQGETSARGAPKPRQRSVCAGRKETAVWERRQSAQLAEHIATHNAFNCPPRHFIR